MPEIPSPELTPEEQLRADNEIMALSLELSHDALTYIGDDAPPELINAWLKNVSAYESQHQNAPPISVYDRIGRPAFVAPELLEAATLAGEIARFDTIFEAHGLMVIQPDHVDDAQFYRFLVEELFPHELPDLRLPGMVTVIDYADFHPDHFEIISDRVSEFLIDLLQLDRPYEGLWLSENLRDDHLCIDKATALQRIQDFRERYRAIKPIAFKPEELLNGEQGTHLMFGICWEGQPVTGGPEERYEGLGVIQLGYEDKQWLVQGVQMPGFNF
ncbi:MAG: hypothetical protein ABIO24_12290 [Saprospiraceae bacterium]